MKKLQDRLIESRKTARYSQDKLAKIIGFSKQSMIEWEKGRVEPKKSVIEKWAEITKVDPAWLLTGIGESSTVDRNLGEESMSDYNRLIDEIEEGGTPEQQEALHTALGKIGMIHRGLRGKLKTQEKRSG